MWRKIIQAKYGKMDGALSTLEMKESFGVNSWKPSEEDGMISLSRQLLGLEIVQELNSGGTEGQMRVLWRKWKGQQAMSETSTLKVRGNEIRKKRRKQKKNKIMHNNFKFHINSIIDTCSIIFNISLYTPHSHQHQNLLQTLSPYPDLRFVNTQVFYQHFNCHQKTPFEKC